MEPEGPRRLGLQNLPPTDEGGRMLHHLRETLRCIPAPRRYGRIMALLLASLGGAVDVFSHMRYEALVATQTGNFILLIADLHRDTPHAVHLRWFSVIFFSCGYLGGHLIRDLLGQRHAPAVPAGVLRGTLHG